MNNNDGGFHPAAFVLANFGLNAGPVVQSITIDFHTDDDLNDDSLLHQEVRTNRRDFLRHRLARHFP